MNQPNRQPEPPLAEEDGAPPRAASSHRNGPPALAASPPETSPPPRLRPSIAAAAATSEDEDPHPHPHPHPAPEWGGRAGVCKELEEAVDPAVSTAPVDAALAADVSSDYADAAAISTAGAARIDGMPPACSASGFVVAATSDDLHGIAASGIGLAAAPLAFSTVSSSAADPAIHGGSLSSSSESEHLPPSTPMATSATAIQLSSLGITSKINNSSKSNSPAFDAGGNDRSPVRMRSAKSPTSTQWKTPSHSCLSRPSSLSCKSRRSQSSNSAKPHAYFASSEEESEAELDEKDSHSSRDRASHTKYGHTQRHATGMGGGGFTTSKSSLRGSKKLAEIACKVGSVSTHHPQQQLSLHSSRVRMTIPAGHKERSGGVGISGSSKPIIAYPDSNLDISVPPPPQTVTVAVGKGSSLATDGPQSVMGVLSPHCTPSLPHPLASTLRGRGVMASAAAGLHSVSLPGLPARKRMRKKKRRSQRHLPRGLPVFKDPRACMWTSTHDANAPSEDRYSSLVNVLLRPPKTPRTPRGGGGGKKGVENAGGGSGNANGGGVGSQSGSSCDGSSDKEENSAEQQQGQQPLESVLKTKTNSTNTSSPPTEDDEDNTSLIRLSLWSVIDGHGGGCVATYAAEVLLPHIAASVARALNSEIVDRGVCNVNGQLRDANALDLDGLIRSSDRSRHMGKSQARQREAGIDVVNPNSIHYRSPYEDSESEGDVGVDHASRGTQSHERNRHAGACGVVGSKHDAGMRSESESEAESEAPVSVASSLLPGNPITHGESVSSVKTSVKTAASPMTQHAPVGTHSPVEVASITRAITDSFLAVDEGWINSIDPVTTHQTSCVSNGRWNAGACALVVFIVQRLAWTRSSRVDHETHHRERGARGFEDTSHNKDAARRRKLDYATKSKSVSSLSTLSSTSSISTEANTTEMLVEESEITETEDDDDVSDIFGPCRRRRKNHRGGGHHHIDDDPHHREGVFIAVPAGCKCHYYRPHDAMLYTAHVGDCRAVMLGSAPPRTIKVPPEGDSSLSLDHADDISEDESSSESIADEISSSEHDSDSSGDMMEDEDHFLHAAAHARVGGPGRPSPLAGGSGPGAPAGMLGYVRRASKRQRHREKSVIEPFVPLPPLNRRDLSSEESDDSASTTAQEHLLPVGSIVRATGRGVRGIAVGGGVGVGVTVVGTRGVDVVDADSRGAVFNNLEEEKLLETEDEEAEEDEIKEVRSVRSGSPTQMDRPPSPTQLVADPVHPPPLPLSMLMRPIDLTTDHSAYNPTEVTAVLRRCNNAPKAISSASGGGIKRVAGSLAVTRALGDAYLKTPRLSFFPYKRHAPYITARPEVNCRMLTKGADRILILASDGVWERASGDDVLRWVRNYYNARIAGVKEQHLNSLYDDGAMIDGGMTGVGVDERQHDPYVREAENNISRRKHAGRRLSVNQSEELHGSDGGNILGGSGEIHNEQEGAIDRVKVNKTGGKALAKEGTAEDSDAATTSETTAATTTAETTNRAKLSGSKRNYHTMVDDGASSRSASTTGSSRGGGAGVACGSVVRVSHRRSHLRHSRTYSLAIPTVSEVIVRKVLNKVRKARNISSLRMLMSLPKGRARRSKHDDITASVVDLSGFVS